MNNAEHRAMRREQLERWLASDGMTVEEWCRLNRMSTSTFYLWLNRFRDEEPEVFRPRPQGHKHACRDALPRAEGRPAVNSIFEFCNMLRNHHTGGSSW